MDPLLKIHIAGLFALADIPLSHIWRLPNGYFCYVDGEEEHVTTSNAIYRESRPWWLVKTPWGLVELGPRKRVYSLCWDDTPFRGIITDQDVTKGEDHVHAYSQEDLLTCLKTLGKHLKKYETHKSLTLSPTVPGAI